MAKYRHNLPLLQTDRVYLSEGGMMTEFFFGEETKDIKVPASNLFFHFIKDEKIMKWQANYNRKFMDVALKENDEFGYLLLGFFTYKARKEDVKEQLDIDEDEWRKLNKDYIQLLDDLRTEYESSISNCPPIPILAIMVPKGGKGDAFSLDTKMTIQEAEEYHRDQIEVIAQHTKADMTAGEITTINGPVRMPVEGLHQFMKKTILKLGRMISLKNKHKFQLSIETYMTMPSLGPMSNPNWDHMQCILCIYHSQRLSTIK